MKSYSFGDVVKAYENGYKGDFKKEDGMLVRYGETFEYTADNEVEKYYKADKEVHFLDAMTAYSEEKATIYCEWSYGKTVYEYNHHSYALIDQNGTALGFKEILEGRWFIQNTEE